MDLARQGPRSRSRRRREAGPRETRGSEPRRPRLFRQQGNRRENPARAAGPKVSSDRSSFIQSIDENRSPKPIEAAMIWPRRLDNQPAHAWLRDVVNNVTQDVLSK